MTRTMSAVVIVAACCALASCGDVTSDLINTQNVDGGGGSGGSAGGGTAGSDSGGGMAGSSDAGTVPEASSPPPVNCSTVECPPTAPVCDGTTGACVGCSTDAQCTGSLRCNVTSGSCVECVMPTDCTEDPERTLCNPSGKCVECTEIGHCSGGEDCIPGYGLCAATCSGTGDCQFDEMCDVASGYCVECLDDPDCPDSEEPFCRDLECTAQP